MRFVNRGNETMALKYSGRTLPEWGDGQQEVIGDGLIDQEHTVWNVEEHRYTTSESPEHRHTTSESKEHT